MLRAAKQGQWTRAKFGTLEVTVVGLGTNNFGFLMAEDQVLPVVEATLDAGINFFDTADSYGDSEERLGRALGKRRDQVIIATKFGSPLVGDDKTGGAAPDYVRAAVERSLQKLGTDHIDLYQLHRPDPATPIADTLAALNELVVAGKVREIGCSNFSAAQIREAEDAVAPGAARFVSVQNHYNLINRSDERGAHSRNASGWASPTCPSSPWPAGCSAASTSVTWLRRRAPGCSAGAIGWGAC